MTEMRIELPAEFIDIRDIVLRSIQETQRRNAEYTTRLTRREAEMLPFLALGDSNARIAKKLGLSQSSVEGHIHNVIEKLGVRNRTQAAIWYVTRGNETFTA